MRTLGALAISLSLAAGWAGSAHAGAGIVNTIVAPVDTNTTYSSSGPPALTTYVAYTVNVSNGGGNTINNIYFTAQTSVTDGAEQAVFNSAEGGSCVTTNAEKTAIQCTIGQLKAGKAAPTIVLFFKAPVKVVNGVADGVDTDKVSITGTTYYAETTGGPTSPPDNSVNPWDPVSKVTLGTNNPTLVRSAVPKTGGSFFTGVGTPTGADTWTTTVVVPAAISFTTAQIQEATGVPLASNLLDSSITTLTIPGSFQKLVITLRRDASTIVKGAKIASARLYYDSPTIPAPGVTYPYEVLPCTDTTYGTLPKPGIPCINRRIEFTKKNAPTPDLEGDWEFEVFALDNGRYVN